LGLEGSSILVLAWGYSSAPILSFSSALTLLFRADRGGTSGLQIPIFSFVNEFKMKLVWTKRQTGALTELCSNVSRSPMS